MNRFLDTIIQKSSWKKAVIFTALFLAAFITINFSSIGVAGLLEITGGPSILDFEVGYTQEEAYDMLTALGPEGRAFYLTKGMPLDFPFPVSYMLCYVALMALLIKHTAPKKWCKYLLFMPVLAMLFDFTENIGIIVMLNSYPNLPAWAVSLASTFGILKFTFSGGSMAVIAVFFGFYIYSVMRGKRA